eukprot:CAMPEP_0177649226 /NCGR_PEP_ID=MMETSP0447-20121125/11262_1 /TAXON_ID=0 /ORGANISM="Stygamoeba regulata, Strain BSH-02190019" /LENGTH=64 /DNA_ID=CAMNT_0019151947 /DNA_START=110 /DNA_END=304 /DNA_ORIENTATION=+
MMTRGRISPSATTIAHPQGQQKFYTRILRSYAPAAGRWGAVGVLGVFFVIDPLWGAIVSTVRGE